MQIFFTIIIPLKAINDYVQEAVEYVKKLDLEMWELIIVPDEQTHIDWGDERIRIIPSGRVGPAKKRDMAAQTARGEVLVFFDDDSYPDRSHLSVAKKYFERSDVVALGGPAITPRTDTFWQRVSGAVYLSKYSGGSPERYTSHGSVREIDDWPSVNLLVRRSNFLNVGGFDSPFWPGEDTLFCLKLVKSTNMKFLYVPEMFVWHHRRSSFIAHVKQAGAYGLHRGFFAKKYPDTSRKLKYFLPAVMVLFFLGTLVVGARYSIALKFILTAWLPYFFALGKSCFDIAALESWRSSIAALPYIVATHFSYGFNFLRGLMKRSLVSRLR